MNRINALEDLPGEGKRGILLLVRKLEVPAFVITRKHMSKGKKTARNNFCQACVETKNYH